jgi:hypothetical protein
MQGFQSDWLSGDQNQCVIVRERESEMGVEIWYKLDLDGPPENGRAMQQCLKERHWRGWVEMELGLGIESSWRAGLFERSTIATGTCAWQWLDHAAGLRHLVAHPSRAHK